MKNLNFLAFDCNGFFCDFIVRVKAFFNSLSFQVQVSIQILVLLGFFLVLSRLFGCGVKTNCIQGCKCGCGYECDCKKENK